MQLKIKTEKLQEMVSKVIRCSSNNKLIPITSLMSIKVKDNVLTLTTTDATNYFYVNLDDKVDCEDFEVSVIADIFAKLIQKTTAEDTILSLGGAILSVKGNGDYKIELPLEEGQPIKFVNKLPEFEPADTEIIKRTLIEKIINYNKPSLAVSMAIPSICNYYCSDRVITSDSHRICRTSAEMFKSPLLITPQVMELLSVMSGENINVASTDEYTLFYTNTDTLYAPVVPGIETFPVDGIETFIKEESPSKCVVKVAKVMELLDRLSLFVSSYDNKAIDLTFTQDGIMFSSKKSTGAELVPYIESTGFKPYTCSIDIEFLRSQFAVQESENVELSYGNDSAIKLVSGNVAQLIALIDEEEEN